MQMRGRYPFRSLPGQEQLPKVDQPRMLSVYAYPWE